MYLAPSLARKKQGYLVNVLAIVCPRPDLQATIGIR
jgi:hypothetical protein